MAAAALALAVTLLAPAARADSPRLTVDWGKLGDVLRQAPGALLQLRERDVARGAGANETVARGAGANETVARGAGANAAVGDRGENNDLLATRPLIGLAPRMSLVARDWGASQLLVGNLTLTDQLRLTRSSRMVVSRMRLAEGRLVPFAQLGIGEWRVDRTLVPALPLDQQFATQAGAGFELTVVPSVVVALEADWTLLLNSDIASQPQTIAGPNLWGSLLAARVAF